MDEEFRYHLDQRTEQEITKGLPPGEARRIAVRAMNGIEQKREECRDMRPVNFIDHRVQDLRLAFRQLRKQPGFACTAILVLALGIAASVAIFGFVDAALVRPLPYKDPVQLVTFFASRAETLQTQSRGYVSYLDFLDWREHSLAFSSIAAYDVRAGLTLSTPAGPESVPGLKVTAGFFRTLGVTPFLGREFDRGEEGLSAPATVMLAYGTWQSLFGANPNILGQAVTLQGEPHIVIGVLPQDFYFPMAGHAEFWATIRGPQPCWEARTCQSLETVARLADGVSVRAAASNATVFLAHLRSQYPDDHRELVNAKLTPLREVMLGDVRPVLLMLLSGAGLLLLIACINVGSLLLARSDSRTREIAVRSALGASSTRLVLQFATEALALVVAGGVCGLILAGWSMHLLTRLLSADVISRMPYLQRIGLNLRIVVFACVVSLIIALVLAFAPALRLSMSKQLAGLQEGSRGSAGTTWRRFGAPLVVVEFAVAVILLVGAGLLGKSLYRLLHVDPGFSTQHLVTLSIGPPPMQSARGDAKTDQPGVLARQIADRIAALPDIQAVGYADLLPLAPGLAPSSTFWIPGRPGGDQLKEDWPVRRVSAGYFATLQAKLLRGRYFTDEEVASIRHVIVINDTAARRYFRAEDPIGKSIAFGGPASFPREIVGVINDIKDGPPETPPLPAAYVPFDQSSFGLVVRASLTEHSVLRELVAAIREVRPNLIVRGEGSMTERMNRLPSTSLHRSSAWLVGGFATIAFLLSVVGLYGVVAYSVGQRTREIGVRMALGAQRRSVHRLIMGEATRLVAVGTALGLICAVAAAALIRNLFFDVQPWDASALATASGLLIVSALLASYIPARRAASVNPIEALRIE